jgi:hypothetical protein
MRAVNADALIPKIKCIMKVENQTFGKRSWDFSGKCLAIVENEPTIEPEREKGHWIETMEGNAYRRQCSVCKKLFIWNSDPRNFCGNCGL